MAPNPQLLCITPILSLIRHRIVVNRSLAPRDNITPCSESTVMPTGDILAKTTPTAMLHPCQAALGGSNNNDNEIHASAVAATGSFGGAPWPPWLPCGATAARGRTVELGGSGPPGAGANFIQKKTQSNRFHKGKITMCGAQPHGTRAEGQGWMALPRESPEQINTALMADHLQAQML
jgi:hypothetical protein